MRCTEHDMHCEILTIETNTTYFDFIISLCVNYDNGFRSNEDSRYFQKIEFVFHEIMQSNYKIYFYIHEYLR